MKKLLLLTIPLLFNSTISYSQCTSPITLNNIPDQNICIGESLTLSANATVMSEENLVIISVFDGPLTGGTPKGVELYVINDINDLSEYGIGSANNGGGTDGEEFTFPFASASAGQYIYLASDSAQFNNWFGFDADYVTSAVNVNGDDAIELFYVSNVIDVFGDINLDGTGEPWDHVDGWAYRNSSTGPDGNVFVLNNWSFSGPNALDGELLNSTAASPVPIGTFTHAGNSAINTYTMGVTAASSTDYTFAGDFSGADPAININLGDTLVFNVNASGHPFWINATQGTGTSNGVVVTNNGASSGSITWVPTASGTFYYNCQFHSGMTNTITVGAPAISYAWDNGVTNGVPFTPATSGDYTVIANDAFGCTDTELVTVTVNPLPTDTLEQTNCASFTWTQTGITYTSSGFYSDTVPTAVGCDSVHVLDLTISAFNNFNEVIKLLASDGAAQDEYGSTVSISGNRAIVGANLDDDNGSNSGSAYIYELTNGSWVQIQKLIASDASAADQFGSAVSISENRVIVGASLDDDNGSNSGAAYIYELDNGSWVEMQKLTAADAAAGDNFGYTVSISGDNVIIGSSLDDDNGSNSGSAYIYELSNGTWLEVQKLTAADAAANDQFGFAVSIDDNVAVVGARWSDKNASIQNSGSAYVFENNGTNWIEIQKLIASDEDEFAVFGFSVDVSNNHIIVGSPFRNNGVSYTNAGSSYLFENNGTNWSQVQVLTASDETAQDKFGYSVSISGDLAIAGSKEDDDNGSNSGSAYVFKLNGASWSQVQKLTSSDGNTDDEFGVFVSISGNNVIAGSPGSDDNGSLSGAAYIFELPYFLDVQTACDSYTWVDGITYTSSNNAAIYTLSNAAGCDSIVKLNLIITKSTSATDIQTACDSYTWIDGFTYTSSNNGALHTLNNAAGCDSIVTLNLTITNSSSAADVQTACDSYTWIDGITYTSSNNAATHILSNSVGCDSIITLNLIVTNSSITTDVLSACLSYTWIDGVTYTSNNNTATHLLTSSGGCDSLVTLDLTITNSSSTTDIQTVCNNYTWIDGVTYTSNNNTATHLLTGSGGCDSLVTLDLTITNSSSGTDIQTACNSYTWIDGITYTSSNNTATHALTNAASCDSLVTLDLTINNVDNGITNNSPTLSADLTGAEYIWLDCDNNYAEINGETSQVFTPTSNGNYAVSVTQNGCTDTSACEMVNNIGVTENILSNLTIYPNPTSDQISIDIKGYNGRVNVEVYDLQGRLLEATINSTISLKKHAKGIYVLKVSYGEVTEEVRVVRD
jgi:plastocyanin